MAATAATATAIAARLSSANPLHSYSFPQRWLRRLVAACSPRPHERFGRLATVPRDRLERTVRPPPGELRVMIATPLAVVPLPDPHDTWSMCRHLAHLSDEALVALVARGDEPALAELYDRVGRVAYGLAFRVLRDDRLAEDAVQEAFLGAGARPPASVPSARKASTWILTLVHRRAVDLVRREERRRADPSTTSRWMWRRASLPRTPRGSASSASAFRPRCGSCRTPRERRSSSPTTAASRSRSSPKGLERPSVRSRAGCSPGLRTLREFGTGIEEGSWNLNHEPDRRLRAGRLDACRAAGLRGAPRRVREMPGGSRAPLGVTGACLGRGRARPATRPARPDPGRRAAEQRPSFRFLSAIHLVPPWRR